MVTYTNCTTFTTVECYKCGIHFGVTQEWNRRLLDQGGPFWCPKGHRQVYCESLVQKLEKRLKRAEDNRVFWKDQAKAGERSKIALRGVVTKKKNQLKRVGNGVCPCCNRHFKNLEKHMQGQHPKFSKEGD